MEVIRLSVSADNSLSLGTWSKNVNPASRSHTPGDRLKQGAQTASLGGRARLKGKETDTSSAQVPLGPPPIPPSPKSSTVFKGTLRHVCICVWVSVCLSPTTPPRRYFKCGKIFMQKNIQRHRGKGPFLSHPIPFGLWPLLMKM